MKKTENRVLIVLFLFCGIIGLSSYFMNATQIKGAAPSPDAVKIPEKIEASVTQTTTEPSTSETTAKSSSSSSTSDTKQTTTDTTTTQPSAEQAVNKNVETYTVKAGQTLWEIGQEVGLSVQILMEKNQLSSSIVFEGQELIIEK